jgi:uncharacterized iron-regulated membrane protein
MFLRRMHRTVGIIFAPFFLLTAVAGMLLLLRKTGLYSLEVHKVLLGLHNWEIISAYAGIVLASALAFMAITGSMIFLKRRRRRGVKE